MLELIDISNIFIFDKIIKDFYSTTFCCGFFIPLNSFRYLIKI
ncbi:hypothetical protein HMPREF1864_01368 [Peptoniphilus sp. DNF00840]|nr:hypothetical protein HMPREF1864_01368 [Peptoniphilus sp. DNF00840]